MTQIYSPHHLRHIAQQGKTLLQKLDRELRDQHHGKFIAIEVDSGDYFLGATMIDADTQARAQHPGKVFYVGRIGHRAAVHFRGHMPIQLKEQR